MLAVDDLDGAYDLAIETAVAPAPDELPDAHEARPGAHPVRPAGRTGSVKAHTRTATSLPSPFLRI